MDLRGLDRHRVVLGWLYVAMGVLGLLVALVALVIIAGGGLLSQDREAISVTLLVGTALAAFLVLLALPALVAGIGLLRRQYWAKVLALIVGTFHVLNVPLGTALFVYTVWFWLEPGVDGLFQRRGTPPRIGPRGTRLPPEMSETGGPGWPRRQPT